jgi:proteasome lid subunit RPN8/RPN11
MTVERVRIARFIETRNVHPEPATRFEIDPESLIRAHRAARAGGAQVVGYFHSHPRGAAAPSATDRALSAGDGSVWAIAGSGQVAFFRAVEGGFTVLSSVIADG